MEEFNQLSSREREVAKLLLEGKSNKLIASALGISDRTVEFHLKNIYDKFQVSSRMELILKLGQSTGAESKKPGHSTVAEESETADNRDRSNSGNWATSLREAVSVIGKELRMESFVKSNVLDGAN